MGVLGLAELAEANAGDESNPYREGLEGGQ